MTGLHPLSSAALKASNEAQWMPGKSTQQLVLEHDEASAAHELAATVDSPIRSMHEQHAEVHAKAAAMMREIQVRYG
jgi:hypothetical protein